MAKPLFRAVALAGALALLGTHAGAQQLPGNLANDPVAKALGPEVINAAIKEGAVNWYGGNTTLNFLDAGRKKAFEERFGIKISATTGTLRKMVDRVRTEYNVRRPVADFVAFNDQYMLELHAEKMLMKWRPPGKELDRINKNVFPDVVGYWWPAGISAQGLIVNTDMVKKADYPKSYKDLLHPKWKGKLVMRDPRSAGGGGWQMLHFYNNPKLGLDYLQKLKDVVDPFILHGNVDQLRDAVLLGQFALGFNGRGEFVRDVPKGSPLDFVVPEEGLAWTPISMAILEGAKRPNAAKVLMTWFYSEVENLQVWSDTSRPIPHPNVKTKIPEMSVSTYPIMQAIPSAQLGNPKPFFKQMEAIFGIR